MATSHEPRSLGRIVSDVVTCPICLELVNSPKSLPCLHTFCLNCIAGHCRDKAPGNVVACPVCRQKFNIPVSGVTGLVSNFVVASLVEAKKTANDVARNVQCGVVPTGSEAETELIRTQGGTCDKHEKDAVRLYCFDCKKNICLMCFAEEHQQHKCKNVDTAACEFVDRMNADFEAVRKRSDGARKVINRLDNERRKFEAGVDAVCEMIAARGEELKQLIDAQVNKLISEVQSLKTGTCNEIEDLREDAEMKLLQFEAFSEYCSELKRKGQPCDVTRTANDLHTTATELLQNDVTLGDYRAPAVVFTPMNIHELFHGGQNLIGQIQLNSSIMMSSSISFVTREMKSLEQQSEKKINELLAHDCKQLRKSESDLKAKLEQSENRVKRLYEQRQEAKPIEDRLRDKLEATGERLMEDVGKVWRWMKE